MIMPIPSLHPQKDWMLGAYLAANSKQPSTSASSHAGLAMTAGPGPTPSKEAGEVFIQGCHFHPLARGHFKAESIALSCLLSCPTAYL